MKSILSTVLISMFCGFWVMALAQNRPDATIPQGENLQVPEGWEVRFDNVTDDFLIGAHPDSADIYFVNMTPGWHITSGPAAIYYHPANTASGNYNINSEIHFFDPGERNREAYGLFIGGTNLKNENQEYLYFLIRNTGEFLIKKRTGEETEVIQNWTKSNSILIYDNQEVSSVLNVLSLEVADDEVTFIINDKEVAKIDTHNHNTNGVFGLRVNHSINLHISDLRMKDNN
ncbi:MAG: hypothetical protein WD022_11990 [Balneolaceae bacterium]